MAQDKLAGAIRPTLFIGLGGTGKEVLLRLRRKFYERFGESRLPCVSYLWLDTDTRNVDARGENLDETYQAVAFKEHERIPLLEGKVKQHLGRIFMDSSSWRHVHEWLYDNVDRFGGEIADGAGGVRAVGRLTFFYHFKNIIDSIRRALQEIGSHEAIEETKKREDWRRVDFVVAPQVFLITSVAGGTGGGVFLDTAFLLRKLGGVDRMVGIILLPNVYFDTTSGEVAVRSYGNAYAALKEIEYYTLRAKTKSCEKCGSELPIDASSCFRCSNNVDPGDRGLTNDFKVEFEKGREELIQGPPFSIAYVLESKNEGDIRLQTRSELFHMIAESLFLDFLPGEFSNAKRSDYSNVAQYLSGPTGNNVTCGGISMPQTFARRYASFGMSKIEIPIDAINRACASQLAYEIAQYWARETKDLEIRAHVIEDMQGKFNAEGILNRFGRGWEKSIETGVAKVFRGLTIEAPRDVDDLISKIEDFNRELLRTDTERPGTVTDSIRRSTRPVLESIQNDLIEWLKGSLENEARGLRGLVQKGGYLDHLIDIVKQYYSSDEEGRKPEFEAQKEQAEWEIEDNEEEKEKNLRDLKVALRSLGVRILRLNEWTINDNLMPNIQKAVQRSAICKAKLCLLEEAKIVAKKTTDFLESQKPHLQKFLDAVEGMRQRFYSKKQHYLDFGESILSIRVFDEKSDWQKFYLLGENPKRPDPRSEQERLLDRLGSNEQRQLNHDGKMTLWEVMQGIFKLEGDEGVEARLAEFSEERFRNDFYSFKQNAFNVLEKVPEAQLEEAVKKLVRCALPMAKRDSHLGGVDVPDQRHAYLGVAEKENAPYTRFIRNLTNELQAKYRPHQVEVQPTGKPWEAYLYLVSYAFPLSTLETVRDECHGAYYEFYKILRSGQVGDQKFYIPLHLSSEWEGKFDDLLSFGDREANEIKESLEVLLFGSILKVIETREVGEKGLECTYRQRIGASSQRELMGKNRREVMEALRSDSRLRRRMHDVAKQREDNLSGTDLRDYYWVLEYLRWCGKYTSTSPERVLLDQKVTETWERIKGDARTEEFSLDDVPEKKRSQETMKRLADRCEWIQASPVLKGLQAWVREG